MRLFGRGSFPDPESRRPARVSSRAVRRSVAAKPGTRDRRPENNKDPRLARVAGPVACLREEKLPSTNALIVVICVCERSMRSPRRSFARYSGRSAAAPKVSLRLLSAIVLFVRCYSFGLSACIIITFFLSPFFQETVPRGASVTFFPERAHVKSASRRFVYYRRTIIVYYCSCAFPMPAPFIHARLLIIVVICIAR